MRFTFAVIALVTINLAVLADAEEPVLEGKPLGEWVRLLKDKESNNRYRAAQVLYREGTRAKAALPALKAALKDPDQRVRSFAVATLGRQGPDNLPLLLEALGSERLAPAARVGFRELGKEAVGPLLRVLKEGDPHARAAAATALAAVGAPAVEAIPALQKALTDPNGLVRVQAAGALRQLTPGTRAGLAQLLEGLHDKDAAVRREAAELLARLKVREALPALRAALKDPSPLVRVPAAAGVVLIDRTGATAMVPYLIEGLKGTSPKNYQIAAQVLAGIGPGAYEALPALLDGMKRADATQAGLAAWCASQIAKDDRALFTALVQALKSPQGELRLSAVTSLPRMTVKDPAAVPALVEALQNPNDPLVRQSAARALGGFGAAAKSAAAALVGALKDPEPQVRLGAVDALLRLDARAPAAVATLADLLHSSDATLRGQATNELKALGRIGTPTFLAALKDKDATVRSQGAFLLGAAGPSPNAQAAAPALMAALADQAAPVRLEAALALCHLRLAGPKVIGPLLEGLKSQDAEVRRRAAEGVALVGPSAKETVPVLVDLLKDRDHAPVRTAAANALGSMGAEAKPALPALRQALHDDQSSVRYQAAVALLRLAPTAGTSGPADANAEPIAVLVALLKDKAVAPRAQGALLSQASAAVPALVRALQDKNLDLRRGALATLGLMGPAVKAAALPAVTNALSDPEPAIRLAAADTVLKLERLDPAVIRKTLPVWSEALKAKDVGERRQAIRGLQRYVVAAGRAKQLNWAEILPTALAALNDSDRGVVFTADMLLASLTAKDKAALPALLKVVRDGGNRNRWRVAKILARFGPDAKEAVPALVEILKGVENPGRVDAARALGAIGRGDKAVTDALAAVFRDKGDPQVRAAVAEALGEMGDAARAALPALTTGLHDDNVSVREAAVTALAKIGAGPAEVLPSLTEVLGRPEVPSSLLRERARSVLTQEGKEAVPVLTKLLADANADRRKGAAIALALLQADAAPAVPALKEALKDKDPRVRIRAAEALWVVDKKSEPAVAALTEALRSPDAQVRRRALEALAPMGADAKAAVPALVEGLSDKDETLAAKYALTLGAIGPDARAAVPVLVRLAKNTERPALRVAALGTLGRIGPDAREVAPYLLTLVKDPSTQVRNVAVDALARIGADPKTAGPVLVEALRHPEQTSPNLVGAALKKLGPAVIPEVAKLLKDSRPTVRGQGVRLLGEFGAAAKGTAPALTEALKDDQLSVGLQAARALWEVEQNPAGVPVLVKGLGSPLASVRAQAAATLEIMGGKARESVPALLKAAKDRDPRVQKAARGALEKIDPDAAKRLENM